jgi:hypothetical protein
MLVIAVQAIFDELNRIEQDLRTKFDFFSPVSLEYLVELGRFAEEEKGFAPGFFVNLFQHKAAGDKNRAQVEVVGGKKL